MAWDLVENLDALVSQRPMMFKLKQQNFKIWDAG